MNRHGEDELRMADGAAPFSTRIKVRFADCDLAGIVFYPRYFEMINGVVEDWCDIGLGQSFQAMMDGGRGIALPTVHVETDFLGASRIGDILTSELRVRRIGGASIALSIRFIGPDGQLRVRVSMTVVLMDLKTMKGTPILPVLRERIAGFALAGAKGEIGDTPAA